MSDARPDSSKRRSSASIRLVLIGSAFILAGCHRNRSSTTQPASGSSYHGSGSHWYSSGRSGSSRSSGTARGGFGASGHAAGA